MSKYRIISIDGGGIRGLIPTILLQRIIDESKAKNLLDTVDLLAGTSTGGLLALGIAYKLELQRIRDMYVQSGPKIFARSGLNITEIKKIVIKAYDNKLLRHVLQEFFGDAKLENLQKNILITTFDLDNEASKNRTWKPKLFHNFLGPNTDKEMSIVDVGLYTSAAPTYFPSVDGYIDGGVYANNPAMCALAQTQDNRYQPTPPLNDVVLLSLGTGTNLDYVPGKVHNWGELCWVKSLINIMLDGTAGIADYQCRQILGERYHRLAPVFPVGKTVRMDDVKNIPFLIEFAKDICLKETIEWLDRVWNTT